MASTADLGGHFWVFMQYVRGLKNLGAQVYWLERLSGPNDSREGTPDVPRFLQIMDSFGMRENAIIYTESATGEVTFLNVESPAARRIFRRADLLLNFDYLIAPDILASVRRSALVDIDPGLLQFWVSHGQVSLPEHDLYFTTGETVGTPNAAFPDLGLRWIHIRPPVALDLWPLTYDAKASHFTTVTSWWGEDWINDGRQYYDNNKRIAFLEYVDLPRHTAQPLELATFTVPADDADVELLVDHGWSVRHSRQVAGTPQTYRSYLQTSRGEFSCAKPSCMRLRNGWVSDRTICYLASGKPAVVQYTGPNPYLPEGEGLFRFRSIEEAAAGIDEINADYRRHCLAARGIAEAFYDATAVAEAILDQVCSPSIQTLPA